MVINNTVNPVLSKNQNLASYQGTKAKPVTWGLNTKPISQTTAFPSMGTKTTTPAVGTLKPLVSAPKTTNSQNTGTIPTTTVAGLTPTKPQTTSPIMGTSGSGAAPQQTLPTQTAAPTAPAAPTTTPKPGTGLTFPNLIGGIVNAAKPNNTQTGLIKDLRGIASGNATIGLDARNISKMYSDEIARVGKLGAGAVAGNLSTGSNVVGSGNAAIASQSASSRMNALANANQAALQGTAQQLTGQNQAATAVNSALTGANTQQATQVTGLGTAANIAQPVQIAPGSTLASPMSGDTVAGGLGGYVNYQTAEQVMGLISQYPDAGYKYNQALTPQQNLQAAQQAIQNSPTYQRSTFGAAGAGSYIGGQQLQSAGDLTQQSSLLQAQAGGAEANFHLLLNLAKQGGVNDTNVPILNTIQRNVQRGAVSSEAVTTFNSVIQSVRAQYAAILGGGTPTDASRREAEAQIPNDISISALDSISKALSQEANNRIVGYNQQIQGLLNQNNQQFGGQQNIVQTSAGAINTNW